jgi:hypothetical protein
MGAKLDPNLLKPQSLSGSAVARDRAVRDENHSPRPDEDVWFENFLAQDAEMTASEVQFMAELRGHMPKK